MIKKWVMSGAMFLGAAAVGVYLTVGFGRSIALDTSEVSISVIATPVPLDSRDKARSNVGKALYVAGWALSSDAESFGGFSGFMMNAAAQRLTAISDKGEWWTAQFDPLNPTPPANNIMFGYGIGAGAASKVDLDAESIIAYNGGVLIAFEQTHRLEWMPAPGQVAEDVPLMAGVSFAGVSNNGGMEAITMLEDGRLLAFTERGLDQMGRLQAWVSSDTVSEPLYFKPPANFAPTDAAMLPNGDVLLLLRHYSAINGVAVKVHHIRKENIVAGRELIGEEILHLTPRMTVDNMEGLDVVVIDENTVRLVMISDDNFNPFQRTLLMMFDYIYG